MNTDAAFFKGDSHQVCQDYALAGENFVVVSDGCSSSEDTDVGSRTVCHAVKRMTLQQEYWMDDMAFLRLSWNAAAPLVLMDLPMTALDCTVGLALVDRDRWFTSLLGDGVCVYKRKDHRLPDFEVVEYDSNAPHYVSYLGKFRGVDYSPQVEGKTVTEYRFDPETNSYTRSRRYDEESVFGRHASIEGYEWVAVMTDGAMSFTEPNQGNPKQRKGLQLNDFIGELMNFKTFTGEFVHRRLNAFLRNKAKEGWQHYDDISMGVVKL